MFKRGTSLGEVERPFTSYDKWITSLTGGSLFMFLSSPVVDTLIDTNDKCLVIIIKSFIFTVVIRTLLIFTGKQNEVDTSKTKNILSLVGGVAMIVFSFPFLFSNSVTTLFIVSVFFTLFIRTLIN